MKQVPDPDPAGQKSTDLTGSSSLDPTSQKSTDPTDPDPHHWKNNSSYVVQISS